MKLVIKLALLLLMSMGTVQPINQKLDEQEQEAPPPPPPADDQSEQESGKEVVPMAPLPPAGIAPYVDEGDVPPPPAEEPPAEEIPGPPAGEPEDEKVYAAPPIPVGAAPFAAPSARAQRGQEVPPPPPAEEAPEVIVQAPEPLPYEVPFQVPPKPGKKPAAPHYEPGSVIITDVEDKHQVLITPKAAALLAPEIRKLEQVKAPYSTEAVEFFGRVVNELANVPQQISREERRDVQQGLLEGLLSFTRLSFNNVIDAFQLAEIWAPNIAPVFRDVVPLVCTRTGKECMDTVLSPDFAQTPLNFPRAIHRDARVVMVFDRELSELEAQENIKAHRPTVTKGEDSQSLNNIVRWTKHEEGSYVGPSDLNLHGESPSYRRDSYSLSTPYDEHIIMNGIFHRSMVKNRFRGKGDLPRIDMIFSMGNTINVAQLRMGNFSRELTLLQKMITESPVTAMAWYEGENALIAQEGVLNLRMLSQRDEALRRRGADPYSIQTLYVASDQQGSIGDIHVGADNQIWLIIEHDGAYALYKATILPIGQQLTAYQMFILTMVNTMKQSQAGSALVQRSRKAIADVFNTLPLVKQLFEGTAAAGAQPEQEEKKRAAQEVEGLEDESELPQEEKKRAAAQEIGGLEEEPGRVPDVAAAPVKEVLGLDED